MDLEDLAPIDLSDEQAPSLTKALRASRRRRAQEGWAMPQRHALALRGTQDGVWDWDLRRQTVHFCPQWLKLMGLSACQALGIEAFTASLEPSAAAEFRSQLQAHLDGRSRQLYHVLRFAQGGQSRALLVRGAALRRSGQVIRMVGSLTDISEIERLQRQFSHDALHDRLTGLPNRNLFVELLRQRLAAQRRSPVAVALLGLDEFRSFNEAQGVIVGDAVLAECGRRLSLRPGVTAARLGGDQFALLFEGEALGSDSASGVPAWALGAVSAPYLGMTPDGRVLRVTACVGWALDSQGPTGAEEIIVAAEGAMAQAKAQGPGHVLAYDPAVHQQAQARRWVWQNIGRALRDGEFELHYQPFVRLSDRRVLGFEALIRWFHPQRGLIMPNDFVPVAEASGQIVEIGRWTLMEAVDQLRRWTAQGFNGEIAVNLSGVQLERSEELLADAREARRRLGEVHPSHLKLEVTESMAMANPQRSAETLRELTRMGFKLSIDDFGTGYSSLAYLHRFPFDTLKVDRSFVMRLGEGQEAQEIVRTIVGLALSLGKQTLAEGVETEEQARMLRHLGVQVGQGWLFAKALQAEQAFALTQRPPWPVAVAA